MDGQQVRDSLLQYLDELCNGSRTIDEAVLDYACSILESTVEDEGDEDESIQHLDALLVGACGYQYDETADEVRRQKLKAIVHEARMKVSSSSDPESGGASALGALMHRPRVTCTSGASVADKPSQSSTLPQCNPSSRSRQGENLPPSDHTAEGTVSDAADVVIEELMALRPDAVSVDFLRYALARRFHGSAEALAAWLLDAEQGELQAAQAEWAVLREQELWQEEEARLLKERNKQHILQKFDLRPVPLMKDPKKAAKGRGEPLPEVWPTKQAQQAPAKVRYLDGRVVTTKGEKYIVEKTGEEWDGGSRGKVYTKGKRGKGFA